MSKKNIAISMAAAVMAVAAAGVAPVYAEGVTVTEDGAYNVAPSNDSTEPLIYISNPDPNFDRHYSVYKIMDATIAENDDSGKSAVGGANVPISYTISTSSPFYDLVNTYTGLTKTAAADDATTIVVTKADGFDAAAFADLTKTYIADHKDAVTAIATPTVAKKMKVKISGITPGYYAVVGTNPDPAKGATSSNVAVDTANYVAWIVDKNYTPKLYLTVNDPDPEVGELINYELSTEGVASTGFKTQNYVLKITLPKEDTIDTDLRHALLRIDGAGDITINEDGVVSLADGTQLGTASVSSADNAITVTLDAVKLNGNNASKVQPFAGASVKLNVNATVNENALYGGNEHKAGDASQEVTGRMAVGHMEYQSNPANLTETNTPNDAIAYTYTFHVDVDKYVTGNKNSKLAGATFVLERPAQKDASGNDLGVTYYRYNHDTQKVEWVSDINFADYLTTDSDGIVAFNGIQAGQTYHLIETEAPDGYNLMTEGKDITLTRSGDIPNQQTITEETVEVPNASGTELPESGAAGTMMIYLIGMTIAGVGAVYVVTRRKGQHAE